MGMGPHPPPCGLWLGAPPPPLWVVVWLGLPCRQDMNGLMVIHIRRHCFALYNMHTEVVHNTLVFTGVIERWSTCVTDQSCCKLLNRFSMAYQSNHTQSKQALLTVHGLHGVSP